MKRLLLIILPLLLIVGCSGLYFNHVSIEGTFKDGKEDGLYTWWYRNGQKKFERTFKDGKEDGLWTRWYKTGQKNSERIYKNGKSEGLHTSWYENGQKMYELTYKDGTKDGLITEWYENGHKKSELTYKDGVEISEKEWNEDGTAEIDLPFLQHQAQHSWGFLFVG